MLTGVETAGLVLAVLPLFISAFEHYNDGLEPIKAFWDIDRLLPIQIRRLRNQHVHFEQTLRLLLSQIVDTNEVEDLIAAPNSDIWRTPEMQESLEQHLHESYNAYQDTVSHVEEIMKKIAKDFKMDHSERANRTNLEALLKSNTRPDGTFEFKRRVKFAMSGRKMERLLNDLDECIKELERFTDKSERLLPYRKQSKKSTPANPLNGVRTYAKALYNVLCVGKNCGGSHKTKLQLEKRTKPPKGKSLVSRDNNDNPCFTVSFLIYRCGSDHTKSPWIWQETRIQVMTEDTTQVVVTKPLPNPHFPKPSPSPGKKTVGFNLPPPPPMKVMNLPEIDTKSLQNVEDLCSAIRQAQIKKSCLGFCLDTEGHLRGVYPVEKRVTLATGFITLKDMLAVSKTKSSMLKMSRKERMNLAVILASSYLQLQATPWLKDTWSKEDIVFDSDVNTTSLRPCNVEQPCISHEHQPLPSQITTIKTPSLPGNPSLLSLGVLLLELYTGQTFEQYCSQASLENKDGPTFDGYIQQLRNLDIVSKWLNAEQEDLSAGYQGAVLHCIRSFFDPVNNPADEAAFRQSIYDQVIVPLQEELQNFLGEGRRVG